MDVKELIQLLKKQDQDLEVGILKNKHSKKFFNFRVLSVELEKTDKKVLAFECSHH